VGKNGFLELLDDGTSLAGSYGDAVDRAAGLDLGGSKGII
jgi:hypothetical protein